MDAERELWDCVVSLPARGAWIEIVDTGIDYDDINVAPRTGSVD